MSPNEERRAVEALAQTLNEAENPAGIVWMQRAQRAPTLDPTRVAAAEAMKATKDFE